MAAESFPRLREARLDASTLAFTTVIALATGILFGIVPALQISRHTTHDSLKEGSHSGSAAGGRLRLRRMLVTAEVALSLLLLVGAGLLIKSFMRLQDVDPGFKPAGVLAVRLALPQARYSQPEQIRNFYRALIERVSTLPGVQEVGAVNALPLSGTGGSGTTTVDTQAVQPDQASPEADWRIVTPGYFHALGIELVKGRVFDQQDSEKSSLTAVIDETMAKTYWPNGDAIGRRI
jgi:hypothetical protein